MSGTKSINCSTLGYMIDHGDELHVICMNGLCSHGNQLNINWLVSLLGRDHSSLHQDLLNGLRSKRKRLRCVVCGSDHIGFRILPGCFTGHLGFERLPGKTSLG